MLGQRLRRWPNIKPGFGQCPLPPGRCSVNVSRWKNKCTGELAYAYSPAIYNGIRERAEKTICEINKAKQRHIICHFYLGRRSGFLGPLSVCFFLPSATTVIFRVAAEVTIVDRWQEEAGVMCCFRGCIWSGPLGARIGPFEARGYGHLLPGCRVIPVVYVVITIFTDPSIERVCPGLVGQSASTQPTLPGKANSLYLQD